MIVLGLTGSIGMGKSVAALQLRALGVPVFDADETVHALYARADIIRQIATLSPTAHRNGAIDRKMLSAEAVKNPGLIASLEKILHPEVRAAEIQFLEKAKNEGHKIAAIDIPLLFETGQAQRCNFVAVVTAPWPVQYARILRRPGMTLKKMRFLLSRQMKDAEKRSRADFVVQTGFGRNYSLAQWKRILGKINTAAKRSAPATPQ